MRRQVSDGPRQAVLRQREGFNNPDHAARRYSWIRPPSTSLRSTGPCRAGPAGSRVEASSPQDRPDRRRGDPDLRACAAPRGSAGSSSVGSLVQGRRTRSRTSASTGGRPGCPVLRNVHFLLTSSGMPAQQGLRPDQERGPALSRQPPARGRQQDPVAPVEPGTLHLPREHLHLVAEHQELDVPLACSMTSRSDETADQEVQEREQPGAPSGSGGACYR